MVDDVMARLALTLAAGVVLALAWPFLDACLRSGAYSGGTSTVILIAA
jgi:hypothetical protein